eukprot:720800_1
MGCCNTKAACKPSEQSYEQEEKEHKPNGQLAGDNEIPTMNSNVLATPYNNEDEPLKTIKVTEYENDNNNNNNNNNNNPSSVLNSFNKYNLHDNTLTIHRTNDNPMVDSHGNIHVNKYYNITRNHNLSIASKMTDLSELPIPIATNLAYNYSNVTNMSNSGKSTPVNEQFGKYKMSVDSANTTNTNISKVLWDE